MRGRASARLFRRVSAWIILQFFLDGTEWTRRWRPENHLDFVKRGCPRFALLPCVGRTFILSGVEGSVRPLALLVPRLPRMALASTLVWAARRIPLQHGDDPLPSRTQSGHRHKCGKEGCGLPRPGPPCRNYMITKT